jgi:hypothetical protein
MFSLFRKKTEAPLTLEQKLMILSECGLSLAPDFTVGDLLESWSREEFEKPGFAMTLVGLGMTEEQPPWRNHCVNLWHFDTECIEDEGSYVGIAKRMAEMTQGALSIRNVKDEVDIEAGVASLAFEHEGTPVRLDLDVNDDWVDPAVFSLFVRLLAISDPSRIFLHLDLKGQDCILACVSRDQFSALARAGVGFEPLK